MTTDLVPDLVPDWDLTPWFSSLGADDYEAFASELERDVHALVEHAETLASVADDREAWVAWIVRLERVHARVGHLSSFLGCWTAADSADERGQREEGRLARLRATFEKAWVALRAALAEASDADFEALVADPAVSANRYPLERTRQAAADRMPAPLESLAADLGVDGLQAWGRLYDRISGTLRFHFEAPGRPAETLPVSMTRSLLEDVDPAVRLAASRGSAAAWESVADSVAACLNAIAGTRLSLYERRGVGHFLDPALFDSAIDRETLDAMFGAVRARQDLARQFLRRKAKLLGRERLGFQDLMAALPPEEGSGGSRVDWSSAIEAIDDAFGAAYPALQSFSREAIDGRWVDYRPRPAKRPGGFCTGSFLVNQSRIFMTFNGAQGDVQTLAHELGHAFHASLMHDLRPWQRSYPMTLAETASTFAEKLVADAALEAPETTDTRRVHLLEARLQDAEAFLLNIPMRFDFEHEFYTRRAAGELSVSELKELMLDAQRSNYGDALAPDELDPWFWASKLHFYITGVSFYNFPYTFGYLFSMGLYARAKAEGPAFRPRYEALLRATGSATAEQVAADHLGVDLTQPDFWNESLDLVEADLNTFQALT